MRCGDKPVIYGKMLKRFQHYDEKLPCEYVNGVKKSAYERESSVVC